MTGLYLHIPFCKKACSYCNFHFSTSRRQQQEMVDAIARELVLRRHEAEGGLLRTVYFGGGTPSLLTSAQLGQLFEVIHEHYTVQAEAEITLEANPDDLTPAMLRRLATTSVNRLSIGIQSFYDEDLAMMNRAHSAAEAGRCIDLARDAGFEQLTIDLIYGLPEGYRDHWRATLDRALAYELPHYSCYALTVEPRTALAHQVDKGRLTYLPDEADADFTYLRQQMQAHGYEHYEISSFARPGQYARHNTAYWSGSPYIGVGPAAHSFDGVAYRRWNVANNARYIRSILTENTVPHEGEALTPYDRYNEYMMTGLRTQWGVSRAQVAAIDPRLVPAFIRMSEESVQSGSLIRQGDGYALPDHALLFADGIAAELFVDEEEYGALA